MNWGLLQGFTCYHTLTSGPAAGNGDAGRALYDAQGAAGHLQAGPGARQGAGDRGRGDRKHRVRQ